jgi:membrane-bound ClpP family serine protease
MSAFIVIGLLVPLVGKKKAPPVSLAMLLLVCGSFVVFFAAHSIFWWKGLFGSYGLIRVIACVVPCGVLIALNGLQRLTSVYEQHKSAVVITLVAVCGITAFNAVSQHGVIRSRDEKQDLIYATAAQIKELNPTGNRMYYGYPLITHALEGDPFDQNKFMEMWGLETRNNFKSGELVVWDSHFGPVQYNLSEQRLLSIPGMTEVFRSERGTDGNKHYFVITRYR